MSTFHEQKQPCCHFSDNPVDLWIVHLAREVGKFSPPTSELTCLELHHIHNFIQHPQGSIAEEFALSRHFWTVMHILYSYITHSPTTHTFWHCYCMYLQTITKWKVLNVHPSSEVFPALPPFSHSALLSVFMNIMNETTYSTYSILYMRDTYTWLQFTLLLWGSSNC